MPTHHHLHAVLLRWIYEHVWRFRANVFGATLDDLLGAEERIRQLFGRQAHKLIRAVRIEDDGTPVRLALAPARRVRRAKPVPPFDLAPIGLPGVLRVFVYPHDEGLRVAVATKADAVTSLAVVTRFLSAVLSRPVILGGLVDDSREFFTCASRRDVERAAMHPGSWLGKEGEEAGFVVLAGWRGLGTDARERLFVSLRWYSHDDPDTVKIEARIGAGHERRYDVTPWDLRWGATAVFQRLVVHEGLRCVDAPRKWNGRKLQAGPDWMGDAEARMVSALAEMDRDAPGVRLHRLTELSRRAAVSKSDATRLLGRLSEWGLLAAFRHADPSNKRRSLVRAGESLALYAASLDDPAAPPVLRESAVVFGPFYSSLPSTGSSSGDRDAAGEADEEDGELADPEGRRGQKGKARGTGGRCAHGWFWCLRNPGHGPWGRCLPWDAVKLPDLTVLLVDEVTRLLLLLGEHPVVPVCWSSEPQAVADALNAAGIPSATGLDWNEQSVRRVARRRAPAGTGANRRRGR